MVVVPALSQSVIPALSSVIPAQAGTQSRGAPSLPPLGSRFRGNDGAWNPRPCESEDLLSQGQGESYGPSRSQGRGEFRCPACAGMTMGNRAGGMYKIQKVPHKVAARCSGDVDGKSLMFRVNSARRKI